MRETAQPFPILMIGDSPAGRSGYATQLALFAPRLKALGHDVTIFSPNHFGEPYSFAGIKVLPRFSDRFGNDMILQHSRHTVGKEGMNLILADIWTFTSDVLKATGNIAAWTPVDHEPLQWATHRALNESGAFPVAMTRHAQDSFATAGFDAPYMPHAYDPEVYKPRDRAQAREWLQVPSDAFVVGIVGDNQSTGPPRKAFPQMLEAFQQFQRRRTDAILYLHSDILGSRDGLDLGRMIQQLGLPPESLRVVDAWEYRTNLVSQQAMSSLYSAFDVLLHTSYGEGFGVCCLEANACGTPVISTDFSAMKEVAYGWHVRGTPWYTALGGWQSMPDVDDIVSKLHAAYDKAHSKRKRATRHAESYAVDRVLREYVVPTLAELGERMGL